VTILCGTDFSAPSVRAVTAAAHLARATKQRLELVHVLDIPGAEEVLGTAGEARVKAFFEAERDDRTKLLHAEAKRIAPIAGEIDAAVLTGRSDQALLKQAQEIDAGLIVVAAVGARGDSLWRLGSTADRVAQSARAPVVVVRNEEPYRAWSTRERPLKLAIGVDVTPTSDTAVRWAAGMSAYGPVELHAVHVSPPIPVRDRASESDSVNVLEASVRARIAPLSAGLPVTLHIVDGLGRPADHIEQVLSAQSIDMLVVGTHQRSGLGRLWTGSVSHDAIVRTSTNVVVVPTI